MESAIITLTDTNWEEYQLLDSGNEEKLEQVGPYQFVRPEPKAIWNRILDAKAWEEVSARYERSSTGGGKWLYKDKIPESWTIQWKHLKFVVKPTGFKHFGVFPEQAGLWNFIQEKIISAKREVNLLNLFAYTGGSTLAAASVGAKVTHIDSSKDILTWGRENAQLSGLADKPIRWIPEDVITFVKREINRGSSYDAIILDPPKFGRGARNEVWKIESDLPKLMELCRQLLTPNPLFVIVNAYAVSYSSLTLRNLLSQMMTNYPGKITNGELVLVPKGQSPVLPMSIFSTWEML